MNWKGKLKVWTDAGLLTKEQAVGILNFESAKKIPYAFYSFLALGISVLGLGVIALIAANWDQIHYSIKLLISFSVLIGLGFSILFSDQKKIWNDKIRGLLVLLLSFLLLSNIGLISQIYHTQGKFYQATGLWCVMTLLLVIFYPGRILFHLWISAFSFSVFDFIFDTMSWEQEKYWLILTSLVFVWVFLLLGVYKESRTDSDEEKKAFFSNPFLVWCLSYLILSSILGTYITKETDNVFSLDGSPTTAVLPFSVYLPFLIPILVILSGYFLKERFSFRKILLVGVAGFFLTLLNFPQLTGWYGQIPKMFYFFSAWLLLTFVFFESRRWFDLCLFVIGVRFVFVYIEVFGSLLETAWGLIISGAVILGFSMFVYSIREKIRKTANQLFQTGDMGR